MPIENPFICLSAKISAIASWVVDDVKKNPTVGFNSTARIQIQVSKYIEMLYDASKYAIERKEDLSEFISIITNEEDVGISIMYKNEKLGALTTIDIKNYAKGNISLSDLFQRIMHISFVIRELGNIVNKDNLNDANQ